MVSLLPLAKKHYEFFVVVVVVVSGFNLTCLGWVIRAACFVEEHWDVCVCACVCE